MVKPIYAITYRIFNNYGEIGEVTIFTKDLYDGLHDKLNAMFRITYQVALSTVRLEYD